MTSSHDDAAKSLLLDGFGRVLEGVTAVVDGLTNDELLWRPDRDANSVAWLLWHLARQADLQIAGLANGDPVWTEQGWVELFALPYDPKSIGYGMSAAKVGEFTIADPSLFVAYQSAVHDRAVSLINSLTDNDYDTVIDDRWDPPVTIAIRIVSVLDDAIKHLGQAEYVKGLLERRRAS
ncbi:MAG: DinB family protein [Terracoccus sp.]